MMGYASLVNLPFIIVQRFNRPRLSALARRLAGRSTVGNGQ